MQQSNELGISGTPALPVPLQNSGNSLPSINKSFDASGAQFAWDATSLSSAEKCPRYYQYKHIEGWQPRQKSVHLLFGGHFATALEHYYKHRALGLDRDEALELVVGEALEATWEGRERAGDMLYEVPGTGHPWNSGDPVKTRETLIRSIIWYVDHFANDPIKVVVQDGVPLVERSFSLNVDNGYVFSGHLDRVVEYSGDPYVMDQKTTKSTIASNYFNNFNPDIQMSMYTFAGRVVFHLPVKGVIIDAVQIAVGFTRFERGFTFRQESQLNEWYDDMMALIEVTRQYTLERYFPMRRSSCFNYGGCEFRHICSKSPQARPNFLAGDFVQQPTWDPLTRR